MKKWIALTLALSCLLALTGCKKETHLEIRDAARLSLYSGLRGDSVSVTDAEDIARITDNLNGIAFDKGKSSYGVNGFAYALRWYDADNNLIADLYVMDETTISYEEHYYNTMVADEEIDTAYLQALLDAQYEEPIPDAPADTWGVTLTAEDVTSTGLTLVIRHSGDVPAGELQTGTPYWLEVKRDGVWNRVPELPMEDGIMRVWTSEGWLIPVNGSRENAVNWENLYGQLPAGQYRIGKEIMLFRGTGDYDEQSYYAEFEIKN